MKMQKTTRVLFLAAALTALPLASTRAMAANAKCPECEMPNEKGTAVTLKQGRKTTRYRCTYCALDQAQNDIKGDLTIFAPTEKAGRNVVIKRVRGKWFATPGASFVAAQKMRHRVCPETFRAFSTRAAAQSYIAKNRGLVGNVAPLSFAQMLKVAKD